MVIPMTAHRLDFKRLRAEADFTVILASYGIDLKKDGTRPEQFKALCPFHDDKNPSLKVNTAKNVYHCFVCEAKGNILEFVMAMDETDIRPAALKVASLCGMGDEPVEGQKKAKPAKRPIQPKTAPPLVKSKAPAEAPPADLPSPNTPLTFNLKLDQTPDLSSWLDGRGINAETIQQFGLGQVSGRSKSIGGRLAIPIHDRLGQLVAYCGRHIGDDIPDDVPKYILPKGFRKEIELFNLHRILASPPPQRFVVLFESFFSVMRHAGHIPALSAMGRTLSEEQISLLRDAGITKVIVVFDGDDPGKAGARDAAAALAQHFWTRIVLLPDGKKPHHLSWDELRPWLSTAWQSPSHSD